MAEGEDIVGRIYSPLRPANGPRKVTVIRVKPSGETVRTIEWEYPDSVAGTAKE